MTPLERCRAVLRCEHSGPPPYVPAIYEHKAWFVQDTPSHVSRDAELFFRAVMAEYEQIEPDALVIGMDVYNVEAEAAGCRVTFYDGDDVSVPGIAPGDHVVRHGDDLSSRAIPNPSTDPKPPSKYRAAVSW